MKQTAEETQWADKILSRGKTQIIAYVYCVQAKWSVLIKIKLFHLCILILICTGYKCNYSYVKRCEKRRECWLPAFSPFPTMFSEASSARLLEVSIVWWRVTNESFKNKFMSLKDKKTLWEKVKITVTNICFSFPKWLIKYSLLEFFELWTVW